jgi:hemerythrin
MAFLHWTPELSIGIAEIDQQHKVLVEIINRLHETMKVGAPRPAVSRILAELSSYVAMHFSREETLMQHAGFPGLASHRADHENLTAQVTAFRERFAEGAVTLSLPLMRFLRDWLKEHILGADKEYGTYLIAKKAAEKPELMRLRPGLLR